MRKLLFTSDFLEAGLGRLLMGGKAGTDDDSTPLDVILIPGQLFGGIYSFNYKYLTTRIVTYLSRCLISHRRRIRSISSATGTRKGLL